MSGDAPSAWEALLAEVPRTPFIPDTIWVDDSFGGGFVMLSKHTDPDRWHAAVSANAPVVTQINLGDVAPWPAGSLSVSSVSGRRQIPETGEAGTRWQFRLRRPATPSTWLR